MSGTAVKRSFDALQSFSNLSLDAPGCPQFQISFLESPPAKRPRVTAHAKREAKIPGLEAFESPPLDLEGLINWPKSKKLRADSGLASSPVGSTDAVDLKIELKADSGRRESVLPLDAVDLKVDSLPSLANASIILPAAAVAATTPVAPAPTILARPSGQTLSKRARSNFSNNVGWPVDKDQLHSFVTASATTSTSPDYSAASVNNPESDPLYELPFQLEDPVRKLPAKARAEVKTEAQTPVAQAHVALAEGPVVASGEGKRSSGALRRTPSARLFTEDQVRQIVLEAVRLREEQLRVEWAVTLNSQLAEQFDMFSTFSRDQISRQMRRSNADYFS